MKKKAIVLTKNCENYIGVYYHNDLVKDCQKVFDCYLYGEGYPEYDLNDTFDDVVKKSNFIEFDYVIATTSWDKEGQNDFNKEVDPHPNIELSRINKNKIFFINKEYRNLDEKLNYVMKNKFNTVFSVYSKEKLDEWTEKTGVVFKQCHFGIDNKKFKDYGKERDIDFCFTGNLHSEYNSLRKDIKKTIFKNSVNPFGYFISKFVPKEFEEYLVNFDGLPSNKGFPRLFSIVNPLRKKFRQYSIYWANGLSNLQDNKPKKFSIAWLVTGLLKLSFQKKPLLPFGDDYIELLNRSLVSLNTLSAEGIFNARFWELMSTGCIIICPKDDYYGILEDRYNCVMFEKEAEKDFENVLENILQDKKLQEIIRSNAKETARNATYEKKLREVLA